MDEPLHAALVATVCRGPDTDRSGSRMRAVRGPDAAARIDVYRDSIRSLHIGTLGRAFPVCRGVLGEDYWGQLIATLVRCHGSDSGDLNRYGDFLPDALGSAQVIRPELAEFPYLQCLAHLEWRIHLAKLAQDDDAGNWRRFATLSPAAQGACSLRTSHALSILRSVYPIDVIWSRHTHPGLTADNLPGPVCLCIHREGRFGIGVSRLASRESGIIEAIMAGATVTQLERHSQGMSAGDITNTVIEWIGQGWITGYESGADDA
jgi:hypothetical protein